MTRHSRPLASIGVACALSAAALVAADEPRDAPTGVTVTKETVKVDKATGKVLMREVVTKEVRIGPAPGRDMMKAAAPVPLPKGVLVQQGVNVQLVQQQTMRLRTILRAEYQLVLTVCEPTKDQRREIARAGERGLRTAAMAAAQWQGTPQRLVVRNGVNQFESVTQPDPRKVIRDALAAAVKTHLSAEPSARYLKEVELRAADEKQAIIRNLVETLDHLLFLSSEQRRKLTDSLSSNWDEDWKWYLQIFMYNNDYRYIAALPDQFIVPTLNRDQVKIWQTTSKMQPNAWRGNLSLIGVEATPLEDAELPAGVAEPEPKS